MTPVSEDKVEPVFRREFCRSNRNFLLMEHYAGEEYKNCDLRD